MTLFNLIGIGIGLLGILFLLLFKRKVTNRYARCVWRSSIIFFALYVLVLLIVTIRWEYLQLQLEAFDFNNDGKIEMEEYTNEYIAMRDKVESDTARNFAFLTGGVLSFLLSLLFLLIDFTITWRRYKK